MGARTRRFTSTTSGSIKAKAAGAAIASAIVVLAGCGGSQGVAESSALAIRGDVASSEASDPAIQDPVSPFDPEVIDSILNLFASGEGVGAEPGTIILSTAEPATIVEWDEPSMTTVVKPPVDAPVVIFQQNKSVAPEEDDGVVTDEQSVYVPGEDRVYVPGQDDVVKETVPKIDVWSVAPEEDDGVVTDGQRVYVPDLLSVIVALENTREVFETIVKIDFWSLEIGAGEKLDQLTRDPKSVTFNSGANDATGTMPVQIASTETALTVNAYKRLGYVFDGWATSVNGSSEYADGFKYPFLSDTTLYARWLAAPSSTVAFNANGGDGTMVGQSANQLTPLKANEFTKLGYVFDGWAFISSGSKAYANGDDYTFNENATLYARWVAAPSSTVTFNANGGDGTMVGQTANQLTPLKANEFTKLGYVFDGWAFISSGSKAYANGDDYTFNENATLYARWAGCPVISGPWTVTAAVGGVTRMVVFSAPTMTSSWTTFQARANTGQSATISTSSSSGAIQVRGLVKKANNTFTVTGTTANGCSYTSQKSTTP